MITLKHLVALAGLAVVAPLSPAETPPPAAVASVMPAPEAAVRAATDVITRVFGAEASARFRFAPLTASAPGFDAYEYAAVGGIVTVRGSSPVAMTRGAYEYLKDQGLGFVTRSGARLDLRTPWPDAVKRFESPFKFRQIYNVVTFGYQLPYHDREAWTREIDWLALHGYNMALAPVGTETIMRRVWQKIGFTEQEIGEATVGPAHQPWLRMGNIRNVDAPLPGDWYEDQRALQHHILGRFRELGITPIAQSFAGFVPRTTNRLAPGAKLNDTDWCHGFFADRRPVYVLPDDPLFAKLTKLYMDEYTREFGPQKYWLVDSFNEMSFPKTGRSIESMLAEYGAKTWQAIAAGNPDAVWAIQGWAFTHGQWNPSCMKAFLSGIPKDRLLVIDYSNDYQRLWPRFGAFQGCAWLYGFVPNMGGKTAHTGEVDLYARGAAETLVDPKRGNLVGFSVSGEGMDNNETLYELLADVPWRAGAIDLTAWYRDYAKARYGSCPAELETAFEHLRRTAYTGIHGHPRYGWQRLAFCSGTINRSPRYAEGARTFLAAADRLGDSPHYRADALEWAALIIGVKADDWFGSAKAALEQGDLPAAEAAMARATELLLVADRLLASHPSDRLDRWLDQARAHGGTAELKAYYEHNARHIITTWGPPNYDYACRVWSGLIRDFYAPRMRAAFDAMKADRVFDRVAWENAWLARSGVSTVAPYEQPLAVAAATLEKLRDERAVPEPHLYHLRLGGWAAKTFGDRDTATLNLHANDDYVAGIRGLRIRHTGGAGAVTIERVVFLAAGADSGVAAAPVTVSPESPEGWIPLTPDGTPAHNTVRITLRRAPGATATGEVELISSGRNPYHPEPSQFTKGGR